MSLDLNISHFIFGNLEVSNTKINSISFEKILKKYNKIDSKILEKDKSLPWRFMNNFKILLKFFENFLISGGEEFKNLYVFLYKNIKFLEDLYEKEIPDLKNPKTNSDFFYINKIVIINLFKEKLLIYVNNKFEGTSEILEDFNVLFKSYLEENGEFLYEYNISYEDSKWTSKWKLITNEKEIIFENIDIYLDTLFKNNNFFYNSSMSNNIKELNLRLDFLYKNSPEYAKILEKKLHKVTEKIFNTFPYNIIYNDYEGLLKYRVYKPKLLRISEKFYEEIWCLSILPEFFSFYLLGFPVVSMDVPDTKKLEIFVKKNKDLGKEKYFKKISKFFNSNYIKSISMGIDTGNGLEEDELVDLCYNSISDYNQDDISCLFSDNVFHCFSCKEFNQILKKQENPYNRQIYRNLNKIIENIKFKSQIKKTLLSRGLDLEIEGTMLENWNEVFEKIKIKENLFYYPYVENNPRSIYTPLLEMLFQSL